eukprot:EC120124.1.p2 GENE.EC120124.1~~EC120124.1.p2  ORF type:complete len:102 (+),score=8.08 EC120124.1:122-427(+)
MNMLKIAQRAQVLSSTAYPSTLSGSRSIGVPIFKGIERCLLTGTGSLPPDVATSLEKVATEAAKIAKAYDTIKWVDISSHLEDMADEMVASYDALLAGLPA